MNEMWMDFKDFYWAHRDVLRIVGAGLIFVCAQVLVLLWTLRRLGELSSIRERLSRLADGLALLTDTTETGLAAISAEVSQLRQLRPAKTASRTSVQKRVKAAVKKGERLSKIAAAEALSESEVRLHLALGDRDRSTVRSARTLLVDTATEPAAPLAS